ncbi:hypothetical protein KBC75_04605 [Candidatus Shapirobacteria bacterium]|nr:hypothetical protein [Candidatus Shapirobacteria bacterium]
MAEFTRSRIERKNEEEITKKTVFMGVATVLVIGLLLVFGLPLLVRLSIFLGDLKKNNQTTTQKVLPPMTPRIVLPFEATNSATILVSGFGEKGTTVELLKNDVSVGKAEVTENGEFNFSDIILDGGENLFSAISISDKSGSSEPSKPLAINFDDQAPVLTMINPSEDKLTVDYADFDVIGQTEKEARVTINGRIAMVDDAGKFKFKYQLTSGDNSLELVVRDLAGNEIRKTVMIKYDI